MYASDFIRIISDCLKGSYLCHFIARFRKCDIYYHLDTFNAMCSGTVVLLNNITGIIIA